MESHTADNQGTGSNKGRDRTADRLKYYLVYVVQVGKPIPFCDCEVR